MDLPFPCDVAQRSSALFLSEIVARQERRSSPQSSRQDSNMHSRSAGFALALRRLSSTQVGSRPFPSALQHGFKVSIPVLATAGGLGLPEGSRECASELARALAADNFCDRQT